MYWVIYHLRAPSKVTLCDVSSSGLVDLLDAAASLGGPGQSGQDTVLPWEAHDTMTLAVPEQSRGLELWLHSVSGLWPAGLTCIFTPTHLCAGSPLSFSITPQETSCPSQP